MDTQYNTIVCDNVALSEAIRIRIDGLVNPVVSVFGEVGIWINWAYEPVIGKDGKAECKADGTQKMTKVPRQLNGTKAASIRPAEWTTYKKASAAWDRFGGVGIVFSPGQRIVGVDLDHYVVDGVIVDPQIKDFVAKSDTYTELSPSKTGLHLLFQADVFYAILQGNNKHSDPDGIHVIEFYSDKRYFTFTGDVYGEAKPVRILSKDAIEELFSILGYPWKSETKENVSTPPANYVSPLPDDQALLETMFSSQHGEKIQRLWNGDTSAYGGDDSSADAALCLHLAFWTGGNAGRIEQLWLSSPLGARSKTQDRKDYRDRTTTYALAHTKEFYTGRRTENGGQGTSLSSTSGAIFECFADIQAKKIEWLWPQRIAIGKLTLIVGDPDLGKSLITASMAAIVSRGGLWPVDNTPSPIGDTILLSAEDDAADTIKPRLEAAAADSRRVYTLQAIRVTNPGGPPVERMFSLKNDLAILEEKVASLPECKLVVIDPFSAYLDNTDSHRNGAVRGLLAPLAALAAKHKVAVVAVDHLNKNSQEGNVLYRPGGSIGFIAAARAAYIVSKDKENPDRRLMLPLKNNIAKQSLGMAYTIIATENGAPAIIWDKKPVDITTDEAFAQLGQNKQSSNTDFAIDFLTELLKDGPLSAKMVCAEAEEAGITNKPLRLAREKLGVKPKKIDFTGPWMWQLPADEDALKDEDAYPETEVILDGEGHLRR